MKPYISMRYGIGLAAMIAAAPALGNPGTQLELAPIFTDHMVLQRDRDIPVRGTAAPQAEVTVQLDGQGALTVTADWSGSWEARLPAAQPTTGLTLTVSSGAATIALLDVAVGDVFLCSGQSNMEFPLRLATDADNAIASSSNGALRLFNVPRQSSPTALSRFASEAGWQLSAPQTARDYSAACYFMGRELQKSRRVPIGLIAASWGGSFIEAWLDRPTLESDGNFADDLAMLDRWRDDPDAASRDWQARMDGYFAKGFSASEQGAAVDPSKVWEEWGNRFSDFDGFATYTTTVILTRKQAREARELSLGTIDDIDLTIVNGQTIGRTTGWDRPRRYALPQGLLKRGENLIEVRVLDTGGGGGLYGPGPRSIDLVNGASVPLDGEWRFNPGRELGQAGPIPREPWIPTSGLGTLANGMIAPIGRIPLAGIAWYQSESNASDPPTYARLLPLLIEQWRARFDTRRIAIAQLANFGPLNNSPRPSNWAELREVQRRVVAADPDSGLAVTIDVGDPYDIHPANKRTVGARLASAMDGAGNAALPGVERANGGIAAILTFKHDLVLVGGAGPIGFEACSQAECRFVEARLAGRRTVELPIEPDDDAIRYLWANSPITNLFDEAGMPVTPFRMALP